MKYLFVMGCAVIALMLSPLAGSASPQDKNEAKLPEGEGKSQVVSRCTICHSLEKIVQSRKSEKEWESLAATFGSNVPPEDQKKIVPYLSKNFGVAASQTAGASASAATPSATGMPEGPGKQAVLTKCSQCHSLERSLETRRSRAGWNFTVNEMISYGATISADEQKAIVDYLAVNFAAQ